MTLGNIFVMSTPMRGALSNGTGSRICRELICENCGDKSHYIFHAYASNKIYCVECDEVISTIGIHDV